MSSLPISGALIKARVDKERTIFDYVTMQSVDRQNFFGEMFVLIFHTLWNKKFEELPDIIGLMVQGDVYKSIKKTKDPELSPYTIAARAEKDEAYHGYPYNYPNKKPLRDSGKTLATLSSRVSNNG